MEALFDRSFSADTAILREVRAAVDKACRQAGCGDECAGQIVLAANEAGMNVIQHAYAFDAGRSFRVQCYVNGDTLVVRFLDNGRPVTESDLCPRELDDLRPGGLGVRFMREMTDKVECLPPPEGYTNLLQLTKRIDA